MLLTGTQHGLSTLLHFTLLHTLSLTLNEILSPSTIYYTPVTRQHIFPNNLSGIMIQKKHSNSGSTVSGTTSYFQFCGITQNGIHASFGPRHERDTVVIHRATLATQRYNIVPYINITIFTMKFGAQKRVSDRNIETVA